MPFGIKQAECWDFQAKATGWRIHLSWNSQSKVQSRVQAKANQWAIQLFPPLCWQEIQPRMKSSALLFPSPDKITLSSCNSYKHYTTVMTLSLKQELYNSTLFWIMGEKMIDGAATHIYLPPCWTLLKYYALNRYKDLLKHHFLYFTDENIDA